MTTREISIPDISKSILVTEVTLPEHAGYEYKFVFIVPDRYVWNNELHADRDIMEKYIRERLSSLGTLNVDYRIEDKRNRSLAVLVKSRTLAASLKMLV